MTATDPTFDVLGWLPEGRVAIEASAGTGKTYTLAALATRYLAEGVVTASELLIVTFTRAATAELRSRIREQMVTTVAALGRGDDEFGDDQLSAMLARQDRTARRDRLEQALADFDAAVISTMHSFAAQVRSTLGLASAIDPDARLTTDTSVLIRHACADALAAASVEGIPEGELPKLSELVKSTELAVSIPDVVLQPGPGTPGATAAQIRLGSLVHRSIENLAARRNDSGTLGFADVLTQLRDALVGESAAPVVEALRARFRVVLIDEFQDTDRVQWEIFSSLFASGSAGGALVLVGDPKQAIYRFRGADIGVYLDAVDHSAGVRRFTLGTNWRSDDAVLASLRHFFFGATFGSPSIGYVDVEVAESNRGRRLARGDRTPLPGLDVRVAVGDGLPRKGRLPDTVKTARIIDRDMVAHIRSLLDDGWIPTDKTTATVRRLQPSDIAVLVTSGAQARAAHSALRRQGVPAVIAGAGNVLSSWAADQVRLLLYAMENPSDLRRVRAYALSWFSSWEPAAVAASPDEELRPLQEDLAGWSTRLADHPVAEVLAQIWGRTGVVARLLGEFDGDRNVTDLDHLAELLHAGSPDGLSGVAGLRALLDTPPESEGDVEVDGDLVARRIESDAQAVQIMTVWKAKGLEFPVVCLPMMWRPTKAPESVVYPDPDSGLRAMDLAKGKDWPDKPAADARKELARTEEAGERLRLLYVALTRARHHTAVWWANSTGSNKRALSCFLFARDPGSGLLDPDSFASGVCVLPREEDVPRALAGLEVTSGGTVRVTQVGHEPVPRSLWDADADTATRTHVGAGSDHGLENARFTARLSRDVHRWSFSSITQRAVEDWVDPFDDSGGDRGAADEFGPTEEDQAGMTGEVVPPRVVADPRVIPAGPVGAGPLAALRAGTSFGTFVHGVLEQVDFAAPDLVAEVSGAVHLESARTGVALDGLAPEADDGGARLIDGLVAAITTPLGPLFDDRSLSRIDRRDRLDEMAFDLRLAERGHRPTARDIGRLIVGYLPVGHLLEEWASDLAAGAIDVQLAGYLTGSIDLVARVRGASGPDRYVVADYKTNQLLRRGEESRAGTYGPGRMAEAMAEHHYPLQAMLYAAALHRYLRWKAPGVPGSTRVAGAAYLFVRGMTGADVERSGGQPHGVFTWEFPPGLVTGLSDLLAGTEPQEADR